MCRILSMRVMMSSPIVLCHYLAMIDELGGGQNTLTAIACYAGKLKVAARINPTKRDRNFVIYLPLNNVSRDCRHIQQRPS
jgi:hypothetical protein